MARSGSARPQAGCLGVLLLCRQAKGHQCQPAQLLGKSRHDGKSCLGPLRLLALVSICLGTEKRAGGAGVNTTCKCWSCFSKSTEHGTNHCQPGFEDLLFLKVALHARTRHQCHRTECGMSRSNDNGIGDACEDLVSTPNPSVPKMTNVPHRFAHASTGRTKTY